MDSKKITIIMPAYNEEERIGAVVPPLVSSRYLGSVCRFIFVVDGSDGTGRILKEMRGELGEDARIMEYEKRLGKGGAVAEGIKAAETEYVGFLDVDNGISPKTVERMVKEILDKKKDCIIGVRKRVEGRSFLRSLSSRAFNLIVRALFGLALQDTQCGCKFFKRRLVEDAEGGTPLRISGFAFDIELLGRVRERGGEITGYTIENTTDKGGSFSLLESPRMLLDLIRLRFF